MTRAPPSRRADYRRFLSIATRWMDNDVFGHLNNVVYYSLFDTAVTHFLLEAGLAGTLETDTIPVVAESGCRYLSEVAFPDPVTVGLRVDRVGTSSVRYGLAVFRGDDEAAAAEGHFVHVFVGRGNRRPAPIPPEGRAALATIMTGG